MKWILFTGTWRITNADVERDVRAAVREVYAQGNAVLTGGATGVDYFAMDEAMKIDPTARRLRIMIPAFLEDYITDYYTNWCQAPITQSDIDLMASLLRKIKEVNPACVLEMPNTTITQKDYDVRSKQEIIYTDEVCAFQVNGSKGTQDTIDWAKEAGRVIRLHKQYSIQA